MKGRASGSKEEGEGEKEGKHYCVVAMWIRARPSVCLLVSLVSRLRDKKGGLGLEPTLVVGGPCNFIRKKDLRCRSVVGGWPNALYYCTTSNKLFTT